MALHLIYSKSPRNTGESGFLCMMGVKIGDELIDTPLLERAKILNRLNKEIFIQLNSDLDTKYPPTRIDCDTPLWVSDQELRSIALLSDKKRAIAVKQLIKQITSGLDSQASKLVGKKKYHVSGHKRFLEVRLEWLISQCKKADKT